MTDENALMFSQCIHLVTVRESALLDRTFYKWLIDTVEPADNGFFPWTRNGRELKFLREQDAVICALKWS